MQVQPEQGVGRKRRGRTKGAHTWPGILQNARTEKGLKLPYCENRFLTENLMYERKILGNKTSLKSFHLVTPDDLPLGLVLCIFLPKPLGIVSWEAQLILVVLWVLYTAISQTISLLPAAFSIIWLCWCVPTFPLVAVVVLQPCCNALACFGTSTASQGCLYCGRFLEEFGKLQLKIQMGNLNEEVGGIRIFMYLHLSRTY